MSKLSNFNVHISKYIKPLIVMTLVFLFIKNWYLYLFIILLFLIYVVLSRGHFMIKYNRFSFNSLFKKISLETPITYISWWSYEFKRPYWAMEMGMPKMKSRQNIVHVYIELKDSNNQSVLLHETIIFGSRFPNETIYSPNKTSEIDNVIKCQRLDKVLSLLENQDSDYYKRLFL